jgi:hypothetical protein
MKQETEKPLDEQRRIVPHLDGLPQTLMLDKSWAFVVPRLQISQSARRQLDLEAFRIS